MGRIIFYIIVSVAVAAFAIRFVTLSREGAVASIESIQRTEGKPVQLVKALPGDIQHWISLAGTVEGVVQYPIISTNTIQVLDVPKNEGDRVEPGDVVVRLIKESPNPMLHSYNRAEAVYQDARKDLERMRNLYSEGAVSKQALDKAELSYEVAKTDLYNAFGGVNLTSRDRGMVTSVVIEEGEMAEAGKPLAWIARTDTVKLVFKAGSRQAMALETGQRAVWSSDLTGEEGEGTITKLSLSADPSTHLLEGEATFPNSSGSLVPGLLVSFKVETGSREGVLTIPSQCLIGNGGTYQVFVAEPLEEGKLRARLVDVETGLINTDEAEIVSGLAEGDMVVKFGQSKLEEGDLIKDVGGEGK
jgi:RND family efflux transporter MFP subunit